VVSPKGNVLGSILFVIFINDLPDAVTSTTNIFADYTKLFRAIRGSEDREKLQNYLNQLVKWSERWQLGFIENKCKVFHLTNSNHIHIYEMNGAALDITHAEKDLGLTVDEDLKFHKNVVKVVNKASRMLGLIRKTFSLLEQTTVPRLFTTMIRPHLEYGTVI